MPYLLGGRPLTLVRHVSGLTFFHEGLLPPVPPAVHRLRMRKSSGEWGTRLWIDSIEGLLGLVEIGAIELHPWGATVDKIERPDTLVFDLDPGEGACQRDCDQAARSLSAEGLRLLGARASTSWRPSNERWTGRALFAPLALVGLGFSTGRK